MKYLYRLIHRPVLDKRRNLLWPSPGLHVRPTILLISLLIALCLCLQSCSGGPAMSNTGSGTGSQTSSPLSITTTSLADATVGTAYSATLSATGGTNSGYTWEIASGSLPAGLTLAGSGTIRGTPTTAGTSSFTVQVTDSSAHTATASLSLQVNAAQASGPLSNYEFTGDTSPVHDPSIIREGSTYYVFSTDGPNQSGYIPIRCSTDKIAWSSCGYVFSSLPSWIATAVPGATNIWAPDISYFNGEYHLYYAVSTFGSNVSAIGLATNTTLNSSDPDYQWVDQGMILQSTSTDNFNAIDPNILVDTDGSVWLTYGSFWSGIYQQQIDPATGGIMSGSTVYHLAE